MALGERPSALVTGEGLDLFVDHLGVFHHVGLLGEQPVAVFAGEWLHFGVERPHVLVHLSVPSRLEGALFTLHRRDPVLMDDLFVGV